jgi:hypothetical protein
MSSNDFILVSSNNRDQSSAPGESRLPETCQRLRVLLRTSELVLQGFEEEFQRQMKMADQEFGRIVYETREILILMRERLASISLLLSDRSPAAINEAKRLLKLPLGRNERNRALYTLMNADTPANRNLLLSDCESELNRRFALLDALHKQSQAKPAPSVIGSRNRFRR